MLSKPMRIARGAAAAWLLGSASLAAAGAVVVLRGEPGPDADGPDTAALATQAEVDALLEELAELVTAAEAAAAFVLPEDLPDLSDAVLVADLPDLDALLTAEELADGYVPAGEVPDLSAYLSANEAASLYVPKSAVPAQDALATPEDLPDTASLITKEELAAATFTKAQLEAKFVTKVQAEASFVPKDGDFEGAALAKIEAIIGDRIAALACPGGMVPAADFCIDAVEASVWDAPCDGGGAATQRGVSADDYGPAFPDSGAFTAPLYACAVPGVKPSRHLTWFQAQQACALSGKRLCTNAEWQLAALGTPDAACPVDGEVVEAGALAGCKSAVGARDMVGNAREMVDELRQGGPIWKNTNGEVAAGWPDGYGDGQDAVRGVNGSTAAPQKAGFPAVVVRGGAAGDGAGAGPFALALDAAPTNADALTGFRCCRSVR